MGLAIAQRSMDLTGSRRRRELVQGSHSAQICEEEVTQECFCDG